MSKDDKPAKLEPRLRFPEFAGEPLHQLQLGNVTEDCTERNGKGATSAPIMGVSKVDGIVPMEERLIGKDTARYKCLETNWFAYNPMRLNIGSIARWEGDEDVLVSPDYVVFRCLTEREPSIDPDYLDHFRSSGQWERFVGGSGDGGVRIRIYYKDLAQLPITLPRPAEQRKIAECLGSLDDWIAAETEALAALRRHKTGLMQQLFPRPGETQPRLRFSEFQDGPEWKQRSLGDAARFINGRAYSKDELLDSGQYRVLRVGNFFTNDHWYYSDLELDDDKYCDHGDLLYAWSASFGPRIWHGEKVIYHYHIWKVVERKGIDRGFLYASLDYETERMRAASARGLGMQHLTKKGIEAWECSMPHDPEEQRRIADCLGSLDSHISARTDKLAALRRHKRGLMQQLFPAPEDR